MNEVMESFICSRWRFAQSNNNPDFWRDIESELCGARVAFLSVDNMEAYLELVFLGDIANQHWSDSRERAHT